MGESQGQSASVTDQKRSIKRGQEQGRQEILEEVQNDR